MVVGNILEGIQNKALEDKLLESIIPKPGFSTGGLTDIQALNAVPGPMPIPPPPPQEVQSPPQDAGFFAALQRNPGLSEALLRLGGTLMAGGGPSAGANIGGALSQFGGDLSTIRQNRVDSVRQQLVDELEMRKTLADIANKQAQATQRSQEANLVDQTLSVLKDPGATAEEKQQAQQLMQVFRGGTSINIGGDKKSAFAKPVSEALAKRIKSVSDKGEAARDILSGATRALEILERTPTGQFAPVEAFLTNIAAAGGADVDKVRLADLKELESLQNSVVRGLIGTATFGALSEGEREFLRGEVGKMSFDTETNKRIMSGIVERFQPTAQMASEIDQALIMTDGKQQEAELKRIFAQDKKAFKDIQKPKSRQPKSKIVVPDDLREFLTPEELAEFD